MWITKDKYAPKLVLKKKLRKIQLWKSNFGTFWHLPTKPILEIQ